MESTEGTEGVVEIRVRYAETDQMGRAHHSHHLVWCELGRTALMRDRGLPYSELERRGIYLPVSRAEVEYRRPVGYDDRVRIHTRVEAIRSRSVTFAYRILGAKEDGVVARARTDLMCTDGEGRPVRMPDDVRRALWTAAGSRQPGPTPARGEGTPET